MQRNRFIHRMIEKQLHLTVEQVDVPITNLPVALNGLTIAHMSDLHVETIGDAARVERAVELAMQHTPDLIALTGDYVTHSMRRMDDCARALSGLRAPLGVFATLGNHDYWSSTGQICSKLEGAGITVLINEHRRLSHNGGAVAVAGLDDEWAGKPDFCRAVAGIPDDVPVILLAHEPDIACLPEVQARCILQLSGHSHGGQVRLPLIGTPFFIRGCHTYNRGLERAGPLWVYTTRGIGAVPGRGRIAGHTVVRLPAIRLGSTPEVSLLRLIRNVSAGCKLKVES